MELASENKFFKEQKKSNVFPYWLTRKSTEVEKLDGRVLDILNYVGIKGNFPITETKIRNMLDKTTLRELKKHGGLEASIKRLEDIGVIYKDKEKGWEID